MIKKTCGYNLCQGKGKFPCPHCEGSGSYIGLDLRPWDSPDEFRKRPEREIICIRCDGTGTMICPVCLGIGTLRCGRILLDASTIFLASELTVNNNLSPQTLHCLSTLIEAIVLGEQILTCEPVSKESVELFKQSVSTFPYDLLQVRRLMPYEAMVNFSDDPVMEYEDSREIVSSDLDRILDDPNFADVVSLLKSSKETQAFLDESWLQDWASIDTPFRYYISSLKDSIGGLAAIEMTRAIIYFRMMLFLESPYWPEYFRINILKTANEAINGKFALVGKALLQVVNNEDQKAREVCESLISRPGELSLHVPLLVAVVLNKAKGRKNILDAAMDFRNTGHAGRFRKHCGQLESSLASGEVNISILKALQEDAAELRKQFNNQSALLSFSSIPSVTYSLAEGFSSDISVTSLISKGTEALIRALKRRHLTLFQYIRKETAELKNLSNLTKSCFGRGLTSKEITEYLQVVGMKSSS